MSSTFIPKLPPNLVLTAILSSSLTIVVSITYIVICIIGLIISSTCDIGLPETVAGSKYLWNVAYRVYIQYGCSQSMSPDDLLSAHTVFILFVITLVTSLLSLIAASVLMAVVRNDDMKQYINFSVYVYIGISVVSLVVDVISATLFGLDYAYLGNQLDLSSGGMTFSYETDIIRIGAFFLMTISSKGYVVHGINIALLGLIAVYANEYNTLLHKNEHSIHKVGAINAFEQQRKFDQWIHPTDTYPPFTRSSQVNNGFLQDDDRQRSPPTRDTTRADYYPSRSFDRSHSWNHSRGAPDPVQGARPFSYLEEIKRPVPLKPTPSPAVEPHWRRDQWAGNPGPAMPAPDYSPQAPRRLKSALKSGYM